MNKKKNIPDTCEHKRYKVKQQNVKGRIVIKKKKKKKRTKDGLARIVIIANGIISIME